MPTYYASATTLLAAPSDANDGLDLFGLQAAGGTPTYNSSSRVLTNASLLGLLAPLAAYVSTGVYVCVVSGTGWTKGLYQLEAVDDSAGTITFKAGQSGLGTGIPTFSNGPLLTLSAAHGKIPGAITGPWSNYGAADACRIAIYGTQTVAATFSWTAVGVAAFRNLLTSCDGGGNIPTAGQGGSVYGEIAPAAGFTTGNPLWQNAVAAAGYLDIENIKFNGNANTKQANYACDMNAANGNMTLTNCLFTAASNSGLRMVSARLHVNRCRTYSNGNFGFYATSSCTSLCMFASESHSNISDGFSLQGAGEGCKIIECLSHNNSGSGFNFAGGNLSALFYGCVAAFNAVHGWSMQAGTVSDANIIGCISVGNGGVTATNYQFAFGGTTNGSRALILRGNYAGVTGLGPVISDATDFSSGQILTGSYDVLRSTAAATFDGRLKPASAAALKSLVRGNSGASTLSAFAPGPSFTSVGGGSSDRIYNRS